MLNPKLEASGPSERDLIIATFEAICALAQRITGERLVVNVGSRVGPFGLYSSHASTRWISEPSTEGGQHMIADLGGFSDTPEKPLAQPERMPP
jgi:hypothetical protein